MTIDLSEIIWNAPKLLPLALAITVVLATAIVALYLPQVRLLPQPWRWALPILRWIGLTALVVSILKPVAVRPASPAEAGGVLIAIDRSRSMSIHDLAHLPGEINKGHAAAAAGYLVGLADGMGMFRPGVRDSAMVGLGKDARKLSALYQDIARAQSELEFANLSGQGSENARKRLTRAVDQFKADAAALADRGERPSGSALLRKAFDLLRDLSRRAPAQWAQRAQAVLDLVDEDIADTQNSSDLALYQSNADVRAECLKIAAMTRFERAEWALTNSGAGLLAGMPADVPLFGYSIGEFAEPLALRGGGQAVQSLGVQPDALRSDLTGCLQSAMGRLAGQPLQAIVVFTDGQQVGGDASASSSLTASGVPVFTVDVARLPRELPLRDIALSRLSIPSSCFVGESIIARADVRSSGYKGEAAATVLSVAVDDAVPTTRPTALTDATVTQEIPIKLNTAGIHKIVATLPAPPESLTMENKRLERYIKVLSDKVRVGLYTGTAGWDFQYVRDAMSRTPWIDLKDAILPGENAKFPLTPDEILHLDILMLFDVPAGALSEDQWDAVYKLVSERGSSVLLVAGEEHLPAEYADRQLPASFLPYLPGETPVWRTWPGKDAGFHLIPAAGARDVDALRLDDGDAPGAADRWAELPAFYRYLSLPELKANARPLLVDRDSSSPVFIESRLGLGRVFFFGATETWRWRYKAGSRVQDRFWLQWARYAADEPYAIEGKQLALDENPVSAEPGQPIRIRARVNNSDGSPSTEIVQKVEVFKDEELLDTVNLSTAGGRGPGRYRGVATNLPVGEYKIRLTCADGGESLSLPLRITASAELEMADLSESEQPMRHISEASGGAFLALDRVGALPEMILKSGSPARQLTQQTLWDSYYLYFLVLACFSVEWSIRKRMGLL